MPKRKTKITFPMQKITFLLILMFGTFGRNYASSFVKISPPRLSALEASKEEMTKDFQLVSSDNQIIRMETTYSSNSLKMIKFYPPEGGKEFADGSATLFLSDYKHSGNGVLLDLFLGKSKGNDYVKRIEMNLINSGNSLSEGHIVAKTLNDHLIKFTFKQSRKMEVDTGALSEKSPAIERQPIFRKPFLNWNQKSVSLVADHDDSFVEANFTVKNQSNKKISLISIKPSFFLENTSDYLLSFDPSEQATLTFKVPIGRYENVFRHSILVESNDARQPLTKLNIVIEREPTYTLHPDRVIWKLGEGPSTKIIKIKKSSDVGGLEVIRIDSPSSLFRVDLEEKESSGNSYSLAITPLSTNKEAKNYISVVTNQIVDGKAIKIRAYSEIKK